MSFVQALLISLWAGYCSYDDQGPQMLRRPLLVGPIIGLILGDMKTALIISGTLELMWMGLGNMAGYQTPDMIVGTIVGVSVSITSGTGSTPQGIAAGVAAATTVAVLVQQLLLFARFVRQLFEPWADKIALTGDFDGIMKINIVAVIFQFMLRAIPTFLVVYFQKGVVDKVLAVIPKNILSGLGIAASILPAVGLAILMTMMMKGTLWPFLILGFVLSTYLKLSVLPVTLIALSFAIIYMFVMEIMDNQKEMATKSAVTQVDDEEEYDL
ncbi:PTS mannose/fructose/sorbose/N-acetylgalactosamine transporter subunit IIC [Xylocopilactobacillus apicola]|uniref:PTS N-acetylgalactosamine transporter subunit IIC n=1 Tax=Xylocopilactobacillus apicola TaxID=2932184 RepID=A0AAU9DBJ3_9LACO|nr:PTS sugar transporter subunit IIC [Xylocopilactobacillus apicola]BDR58900.1 PTS N-acetylgalactosamine transporter subunit IIC [Xylocopilactobacillus apicola]